MKAELHWTKNDGCSESGGEADRQPRDVIPICRNKSRNFKTLLLQLVIMEGRNVGISLLLSKYWTTIVMQYIILYFNIMYYI